MSQVSALAVGNIFEHVMYGTALTGRPTQMVTRWQLLTLTAATSYPAGILAVVTALELAMQTAYKACLPSDWTANGAKATRIAESETVYPPVRSRGVYTSFTGPGTFATGTTQAANIAAVIQRFSYKAGRTEQGELRIGPIASTAYTTGTITGTLLGALNTLALVLTNTVNLASSLGSLIPISWRTGTKAVPHQPFLSQYFAFYVPPNISSMRRRKDTPFGF